MFDIRIDDASYKTVSKKRLGLEIGLILVRRIPFFTIQVIDKFGHQVMLIDGDLIKQIKN